MKFISICPLYGIHEALIKGKFTVYDEYNNNKAILFDLYECGCGKRVVTYDGWPASNYNPSLEHYSMTLYEHYNSITDSSWYSVKGFSYMQGIPAGWSFFYQ